MNLIRAIEQLYNYSGTKGCVKLFMRLPGEEDDIPVGPYQERLSWPHKEQQD